MTREGVGYGAIPWSKCPDQKHFRVIEIRFRGVGYEIFQIFRGVGFEKIGGGGSVMRFPIFGEAPDCHFPWPSSKMPRRQMTSNDNRVFTFSRAIIASSVDSK
jgi:hypothetical protein